MSEDIAEGKRVLEVEAQCIMAARERLDERFSHAIELIAGAVKSGGKVVVIGVGKSGKVAAKVAATLASMGTPAIFLHPTEASHGDLGMVAVKDLLLAFSYSGSSDEILRLMPRFKGSSGMGNKLISVVGNMTSALAQSSDVALDGSVAKEACPMNLAPTSSTTVAQAIGDAIALVLARRFEFKEEDFASNHPGGTLGRRLTLRVSDLMKKGEELPWVDAGASMDAVVDVATEKKLGAVLVRDGRSWLGLITDGDLRRALKHKEKFFNLRARDIMTTKPVFVGPDDKAFRALELMEKRSSQISVLPVVDSVTGQCVGLVRLHDLIGRL